jgi:hypothetical protein
MLDRFDPSMFTTPVIIHRAIEAVGLQGGVNPTADVGRSYMASVQPQGASPMYSAAGAAQVPSAPWSHNVFIPIDPADTLIPSLVIGDQLDILDPRGKTHVTTIQDAPDDMAFEGVAWWLKVLEVTATQ